MNCWRTEDRRASGGAIFSLWLAATFGILPAALAQTPDAEPEVKMSRSGICHARGTVHYQQTIYFEPFDSMEACLAASGRRMGAKGGDDSPQADYRGSRPPKDYTAHLIVGLVVVVTIFAAVVLPRWRRWKARRSDGEFADRERRHWEGHRLEPRKPRK